MPSNVVKSFAKKANMSVSEVEKKWDEAKKKVEKEYPDVKKDSESYYKLVTSITKSMIGLRESFLDKLEESYKELSSS